DSHASRKLLNRMPMFSGFLNNTLITLGGVSMKSVLHSHAQEPIPEILPVIPTMDVVVFPHMIVPLLVLDEKIIKGVNRSLQESKMVLLLAAKNNTLDNQGAI